MNGLGELLERAAEGLWLTDEEAHRLARLSLVRPADVIAAAGSLRDRHLGPRITFSKKVFIPLTKLCRDLCGYCTFVHPPREGERAYLSLDEVVAIARAGEAAGYSEALFTLGDKPERKWEQARRELEGLGHATT
ncbi:MAG: 7,8-didemethyl-8-hydroxy-5-deazariboflavin synthase, partial [Actinobacteria bacterium]|nr:7,8-didemethyl-8-hydroxy-5-deazariboflavin synthase [Actinomycetota bacterium]